MLLSDSYFDSTLAVVVGDYLANDFQTLLEIYRRRGMRIGVVGASELEEWVKLDFPDVELVPLEKYGDFFEGVGHDLDGLFISAEAGSAWTLLYPKYHVLVPPDKVALPYVYPIAHRDEEMENLLDHWIELRRKDRTITKLQDYWVYGRKDGEEKPRWSIVRDVLGWVD